MKLLPEEEAKVLSKPTLIYIGQTEKLICKGRFAPKYMPIGMVIRAEYRK